MAGTFKELESEGNYRYLHSWPLSTVVSMQRIRNELAAQHGIKESRVLQEYHSLLSEFEQKVFRQHFLEMGWKAQVIENVFHLVVEE